LQSLQPLIFDYLIPFSKSENIVLIYKNAIIDYETFKGYFREISKVIHNRLKDYKIQKIENKHIFVLMKVHIRKNDDFKLKPDFFDLPLEGLRPDLYKVEDVDVLELKVSKMDGASQAVRKHDFLYERKQRETKQKNKEFYHEYKKYESVEKLVELGIIHAKDALHYKEIFDFLKKDAEEREDKLKKKIKKEDD